MKTAELTGALLNAWVARAEGRENVKIFRGRCFCDHPHSLGTGFNPTGFWGVGGPIIERDGIGISKDEFEPVWHAELEHPARPDGCQRSFARGPTPLIAAMRAKVASVYGDVVPDNGFEAYIGTEYTKAEVDRLRARQRAQEIESIQLQEIAKQPDPR